MKINPEKFVRKAVKFIRDTVEKADFEKVIVAVSGGVDSATTLALAAGALGKENVFAVMLPYGKLNEAGVERAKLMIDELKIPRGNAILVDIEDRVAPFLEPRMDRIRRGNVMARVRMIVLYDLAKKHAALVCGTENKSEYLLSYFTRYGDEASDLEPIRSLYKTQVYQLAEYLGVPAEIRETPPTAGLWQDQTDEGELGFSYAAADPVLYLLYDKKLSVDETVTRGYNRKIVEKVKVWVDRNEFKHQLPYVLSF